MDRLNCLQAFVTVVEANGFSEAARRLQVSKALISKQIGQLEDSLGVRLLHRTTRQVSTTSSGRAYYEQAKPLLEEFQELDASVQTSDQTLQGELRITAPVTYAELHLLPVISRFSAQFPQVRVQLDLNDRFVNLVEERIDLAIRIGKLEESSLVSRRIGETRMYICASPAYLAANPAPQTLEELQKHPCIIDNNHPDGSHWRLKHGADKQVTVAVQERIQVNNARAARELVLSGNGIGLLPSFAVAGDLSSGRLVQLLKPYSTERIGIYAVYLHRKHLSPKVRKFLDMLTTNPQPPLVENPTPTKAFPRIFK